MAAIVSEAQSNRSDVIFASDFLALPPGYFPFEEFAQQFSFCELHLWGGVFKGRFADPIIEEISKETAPKGIKIVNQSSENAAVIFARTFKKQDD